ncbi:DUF2806 domain-containing protein [Rhizobium brockwellii]|uniref:DUF2806 domain-containing protein n=1 Tax=Rhizobium brockwellii TaxID=3019932 RepID=UPI003F9DF7C4
MGNLTNTLQIAADLSDGHEDVFEPDPLFDDWIYQWQSYAENISDEQIQRLWARILLSARSLEPGPKAREKSFSSTRQCLVQARNRAICRQLSSSYARQECLGDARGSPAICSRHRAPSES